MKRLSPISTAIKEYRSVLTVDGMRDQPFNGTEAWDDSRTKVFHITGLPQPHGLGSPCIPEATTVVQVQTWIPKPYLDFD